MVLVIRGSVFLLAVLFSLKVGQTSLAEFLTSFTHVTQVLWYLSYIHPLVMTKLGPNRLIHKFVGYI